MARGAKWVKTWICSLAILNDQFRDDDGRIDFEALGREEYAFRMALIRQDFTKSERAEEAWNDAQGRWEASVDNGKKGGRPKKEQAKNQPKEQPKEQPGKNEQSQNPTPPTQKPNEPEKHAVGEFGVVMLTELEEIRLRETWEKEKMDFDMGISLLESYLLNNPKGKKYTSHAAVLRKGNWVWNQCLENMTKRERLRAASNSGKSFQQMEREREAEMIRGSGLLG